MPPQTDFKLLLLLLWLSLSSLLFITHHFHRHWVISLCYSEAKCLIYLGGSPFIYRGTVCVPLDVFCYYCISMYLVAFLCYYFRYMCNWGRMFPAQHKMVQCHYQQLICWHILSLPRNNVKDVKKDWSLHPHCISIETVLNGFEDTGELLYRASWPLLHFRGAPQGECQLTFFSHMRSLLLYPV